MIVLQHYKDALLLQFFLSCVEWWKGTTAEIVAECVLEVLELVTIADTVFILHVSLQTGCISCPTAPEHQLTQRTQRRIKQDLRQTVQSVECVGNVACDVACCVFEVTDKSDYGEYVCVASNARGSDVGYVQLIGQRRRSLS